MGKKLQTYRMQAGNEDVGEHKATTPSKALREFFGADLVEQSGRYGKLADGRSCVALLVHGGRRYFGRGDERNDRMYGKGETGMTDHASTYTLAARYRGELLRLEDFPSYDAALVAHAAASEVIGELDSVTEYVVRSTDDPALVKPHYPAASLYDFRAVSRAVREWHRREVGEAARCFIAAAGDGEALHAVVTRARESLTARGHKVERFEVEDAVKRRVLLGRCRSHETRRAFWAKKSEGPLYRMACPDCGRRLDQTSLALDATFRRLPPKTKVAA